MMLVDEDTELSMRKTRRARSPEEKSRIVAETLLPGASVSEVARRHSVNTNLVFNWRREARQGQLPAVAPQVEEADRSAALEFIPIGVLGHDDDTGEAAMSIPIPTLPVKKMVGPPHELSPTPKLAERTGVIEIDLPDGARVRTDSFVNERALRRVLKALKSIS